MSARVANNKKKRSGYTLAKMRKQRLYYLFLIPATITLILFSYLPMTGLIMAFQEYKVKDGFFGSEWVGLAHFADFLTDKNFFNAFKNTMQISVLHLVVGFPAPIILALMLDEVKNPLAKKFAQTVTYLPHFISWVIIATLVYRLLDVDSGIVNYILKLCGKDPVAFMREGSMFKTILIIVMIWKEIGWNAIIYLAAIASIDPQIYEAAVVDGASKMQRLWHITIPSILPTAVLMLIINVGNMMRVNFDAVFNMMNAMVGTYAETIDTFVYKMGVRQGNYSYATAIGLTQSVISIVLVLISLKLSKRVNDGKSII